MATILAYESAAACWITGMFDDACVPANHFGTSSLIDSKRAVAWSSLIAADRADVEYRISHEFGAEGETTDGTNRIGTPLPYAPSTGFKLTAGRRKRLESMLGEHLSAEMHVLVPSIDERVMAKHARSHIHSGELPSGSLVRLIEHEDLYAASPEFAFYQMARKLSEVKLAQLGCELCSTYHYREEGPGHIGFRQLALSSSSAIESFLDTCGSGSRQKLAKRAAKHIVNLAHSPMETVLALVLTLPVRLGGYGLPKPDLNYSVRLKNRETGCGSIRYADLCWPEAKLVVEYYGEQYHSSKKSLAADSFRQNDLVNDGWMVLVATKEHFAQLEHLDTLVHQIAKRLGHRVRWSRLGSMRERRLLVSSLMGGCSLSELSIFL